MFSSSTLIGIAVLVVIGVVWYLYSTWKKIAKVKEEAAGKVQCIFHMKNKDIEVALIPIGPNGTIEPPEHHVSMKGQKYQVVHEAVRLMKYPLYEEAAWAQTRMPTLYFNEGNPFPIIPDDQRGKKEEEQGDDFKCVVPANAYNFISNAGFMDVVIKTLNRGGFGGGNEKQKLTLLYILIAVAIIAGLAGAYISYKNGQDFSAYLNAQKAMWGY